MDMRVQYLTLDISQQTPKSAVESQSPKRAGMNMASETLDFVVQGAWPDSKRYEMEVEGVGNV